MVLVERDKRFKATVKILSITTPSDGNIMQFPWTRSVKNSFFALGFIDRPLIILFSIAHF